MSAVSKPIDCKNRKHGRNEHRSRLMRAKKSMDGRGAGMITLKFPYNIPENGSLPRRRFSGGKFFTSYSSFENYLHRKFGLPPETLFGYATFMKSTGKPYGFIASAKEGPQIVYVCMSRRGFGVADDPVFERATRTMRELVAYLGS